uniref:Uncharacterized protein n=1 Tax=Oryza sativa subsp. japonica TaxID=39947 RepID=Q69J26_ORYSJ|nr:hypothetical protein [Oryza sativa Japonica Group]BAD32018.1 hypothetical protein [Oryza sativa Japonica Group]
MWGGGESGDVGARCGRGEGRRRRAAWGGGAPAVGARLQPARGGRRPTGGPHLSAPEGEREGGRTSGRGKGNGPAHKGRPSAGDGWTGPTAQEEEKGGKRKNKKKKGFSWD